MISFFNDEIVRADPGYLLIRDDPRCATEKADIEELWKQYYRFADSNFLQEAPREGKFQARFWEMYLGVSLLKAGLTLDVKTKSDGPDLCVIYKNSPIWIEAISPSDGRGRDAAPAFNFPVDDEVVVGDFPEKQIILRFTSAIRGKSEQFKKYALTRSGAQIIAVNGGAISHASLDSWSSASWCMNQLPILKALIAQGDFFLRINTKNNQLVEKGYQYQPGIYKASGNIVSTDFFLEEVSSHISGILYNSINSRNYSSDFQKGYVFIHNPKAENPVSNEVFNWCWQCFIKIDANRIHWDWSEPVAESF